LTTRLFLARALSLSFSEITINFDPSSFSHVTRLFVCKQTVTSFGVLFVLKCSFCHAFLFAVDVCSLTV